jgi:rubrerythrin
VVVIADALAPLVNLIMILSVTDGHEYELRKALNPPNSPNDPRGRRIEELGTYEMIWDCKFCGSTNLPAKTHKFCPNCGAAQDPATRRFPSDEEKRAVENYVRKGADLICRACSTPNASDNQFCMQCGAPLDQAERAATVGDQVRAENDRFEAQAVRDLSQERFEAEMRRVGVIKDGAKKRSLLPFILIGIAIIVCIGVIIALTAERQSTAIVTGHRWERTIAVEQFSSVRDSAWDEQVPPDAYNLTCRQEQRSTRRVQDGEDCQIRRIDNGDGTFSERRECVPTYREEPVYDQRCSYTVDRWVESREARAEGASLASSPAWPNPNLQSCTTTRLGCEREGGRSERYILILRSDNNTYECGVSQQMWETARVESSWTLDVGVVTGQPDCASLQPAA